MTKGPHTTAWVIGRADFNIASVRYRAVYPAMALTGQNHQHLFFDSPKVLSKVLGDIDQIVLVKRVDAAMINIVAEARDRGIRVYLEMCDDILSSTYRPSSWSLNRMTFAGIRSQLSGIITTVPYLKDIIVAYGVDEGDIAMVPDLLETPELQDAGREFFEARIVREAKTVRTQVNHTLDKISALHARIKTTPFKIPSRLIDPADHALRQKATDNALRVAEMQPRDLVKTTGADKATAPANSEQEAWRKRKHKIVWFGNSGTPNTESGYMTLIRAIAPLRSLAEDYDFVLHIVSNDVSKYKAINTKLGVRAKYTEWSPEAQEKVLHKASATLLTVGTDSFSQSKSANRALLSLSRGVPVVAQSLSSLDPLSGYIQMDDIEAGLRRYLDDPTAGQDDIKRAKSELLRLYSLNAVAPLWTSALGFDKPLQDTLAPVAQPLSTDGRPRKLLAVIDLIQDIDLLLPILARAQARGHGVAVVASERVLRGTQKLFEALARMDIVPTMIRADDVTKTDYRWLRDATDVITAVETNKNVHKIGHYVTRMARERGLGTYTLQHGFENIGLTYQDPGNPDVDFASETILLWQDADKLPAWVPQNIRERGVGVGRVVPVHTDAANAEDLLSAPKALPLKTDKPIIGVFESLHWDRFSDHYRREFVESLVRAAEKFSQYQFLLKPHPAGKWMLRDEAANARLSPLFDRGEEGGIVLLSPMDMVWEKWSAAQLMPHLSLAITTPSSVVLDAAEHDTPIAIHQGDLAELDYYQPVTMLRERRDWDALLSLDPYYWRSMADFASALKEKTIKPGDPIDTIIDMIYSA